MGFKQDAIMHLEKNYLKQIVEASDLPMHMDVLLHVRLNLNGIPYKVGN